MDGAAAAAAAEDDAEESVRTVGPAARALTAEAAAAIAFCEEAVDDDTTPGEAPAAALAAAWGSRRRPHIGFELKTACACAVLMCRLRMGRNRSIEMKGLALTSHARPPHVSSLTARLRCMLLGFV